MDWGWSRSPPRWTWSPTDSIRHEVKRLADGTFESGGYGIADWEIGQVTYTEAVNRTQPVALRHAGWVARPALCQCDRARPADLC